jgi:hypothetical protein
VLCCDSSEIWSVKAILKDIGGSRKERKANIRDHRKVALVRKEVKLHK